MSTYIKLSTQEYPRHIGDIELDPAGMSDYAPVEWVNPPQVDLAKYMLKIDLPIQIEGKWVTNWAVVPIPDDRGAAVVREKRNKLLTESDWTQLADSPVDKAVWATYRQQLRNISAQAGFPWEIQWPTPPQ